MGICCVTQGTETQAEGSVTGWGVGWGGDGREAQEGGEMGVPMADSCWCMTEIHKILYSNYPSIIFFFIFKKETNFKKGKK